jgi:hypothetical protein
LIKTGQFKLRKVDVDLTPKPALKPKVSAPDGELTVQDLLQRAAAIREAVACSDSSGEGEEVTTTSW